MLQVSEMPESYRYQLLGRLRSDAEYYLSTERGGKLWGYSPSEHIKAMKDLFTSLDVKPEWLSWEKILEYEKVLLCKKEPYRKYNVFFVERTTDDGETFMSYMNEPELADYINMADCHNESYDITIITESGTHHCSYKGWQPGCLIEVVDDVTGKTVLSCIGEDH